MLNRLFLVLLLMCAGICVPADSVVLKGQIEHSDKLEPVNQAVTPGAVFDVTNLGPLPRRPLVHGAIVARGRLVYEKNASRHAPPKTSINEKICATFLNSLWTNRPASK